MMAAMHRWLLVLLVALLPLRGWVGDAMAGQMLQQQLAAAVAAMPAGSGDHVGANAHEDCMGHEAPVAGADAMAHADAGVALDGSPAADCPTCASCQACSSVALASVAPAPIAARFSQPPPASFDRAHASAERTSAFKPPIS
jgi:hypothetical protein